MVQGEREREREDLARCIRSGNVAVLGHFFFFTPKGNQTTNEVCLT